MARAVQRLAELGGGIVVVESLGVRAELPLPVAGLLSDAPLEAVLAGSHACVDAARALGCSLESPFQSLAFLALSVIPSLKITDRGLVDVDRFELVPLRADYPVLRSTPTSTSVYTGAYLATMDDAGTEHSDGWLLVEDGLIVDVGRRGPAEADERIDLGGALVTPGLVNTHHHLYQTLTRTRAQQADLFTWLRELYPVWARIDAEAEYAAARTGLAELALSGCSTVFDHHYVFPQRDERARRGRAAGRPRARRSHRRRARVDGPRRVAGRAAAGLARRGPGRDPRRHGAPRAELARARTGRRVQIAVAPCSPFSVTRRLMEESAALARRLGLQLHTHLAETVEEEAYCRELYGCRPVEYLAERLGWLDDDVWCAHCVHLSASDVAAFGATGIGVAHCPTSNLRLGAGVAPVRELLDAGVRVGPRRRRLGVERAQRPLLRGEAGAARRARARWARRR